MIIAAGISDVQWRVRQYPLWSGPESPDDGRGKGMRELCVCKDLQGILLLSAAQMCLAPDNGPPSHSTTATSPPPASPAPATPLNSSARPPAAASVQTSSFIVIWFDHDMTHVFAALPPDATSANPDHYRSLVPPAPLSAPPPIPQAGFLVEAARPWDLWRAGLCSALSYLSAHPRESAQMLQEVLHCNHICFSDLNQHIASLQKTVNSWPPIN